MITRLIYWLLDYAYAFSRHLQALSQPKPPSGYTIASHQPPVILISGIYEPWLFMKPLADMLHQAGHPIYFAKELGYHTTRVSTAAGAIRRLIEQHQLTNVTIVAHSKGGLAGKHLLACHNHDHTIAHLIAIATPSLAQSMPASPPSMAPSTPISPAAAISLAPPTSSCP